MHASRTFLNGLIAAASLIEDFSTRPPRTSIEAANRLRPTKAQLKALDRLYRKGDVAGWARMDAWLRKRAEWQRYFAALAEWEAREAQRRYDEETQRRAVQ